MRTFFSLLVLIGLTMALLRYAPQSKPLADSATPAAIDVDSPALPHAPEKPSETPDSPRETRKQLESDQPEVMRNIHRYIDQEFRKSPGNGRSRGGAHVLMSDGGVVWLTDTIASPQPENHSQLSSENSVSPYGLWGALGTRVNTPPDDTTAKTADHSFARMSALHIAQQGIQGWKVQFIQLVSLDRFAEPMAYVQDELPDMKTIADQPLVTRPLDEFELAAIAQLRTGRDLIHQRESELFQMVGSIRASKACVECHAADEGQLLGAFTYRFRPKP